MPRTTTNRKATQKPRRNTRKRQDGEKLRCSTRGRSKATTPKIIANSFHSLILKTIPGVAVKVAFDSNGESRRLSSEVDYSKMYYDLRSALINALKIVKNEKSKFDPLASGMNMSLSIHMITNAFRNNILPSGCNMNVDYNEHEEEYYFTIYKRVDFQEFWHYFPIKPIVLHLEKKDKALLELFVGVMYGLRSMAGFSSWFGGNMWAYNMVIHDEDGMIDMISDRCEDEEEEMEELYKYQQTVHSYKKGDAFRYMNKLSKAKYNRNVIVESLSKRRKKTSLINWMCEAVSLLDDSQTMSNFDYMEEGVENGEGCVNIYQMVSIIWEEGDYVFNYECEAVDNEAMNFGVQAMTIHIPIGKQNKTIPLDTFSIAEKWPAKITKLFHSYHKIIDELKKKHA